MIDLAAVMTAIADTVGPAGAGLLERTWDYPTNTITPPCLVIGYPESAQSFDNTMARGSDRSTFPAWIVVGRFVERTARDELAGYVDPFKAAIEDPEAGLVVTSGDLVRSVRVATWAIEPFVVEGLDYVSVKFELDVLT